MKEKDIKDLIQKDIDYINESLKNPEFDKLKDCHMYIDGKYQSEIKNWGASQCEWDKNEGFAYDFLGHAQLIHNLKIMSSKLQGYLQMFDLKLKEQKNSQNLNIYNVNQNKNNNSVTIKIDFKNIEENIKNSGSLTETETMEALDKIEKLKNIYYSKDTRKIKWKNIKPILAWLGDKSVDLAIQILPIILSAITK